ncbi:WYL domain-containing protein [Paradevosia shaoguanensis]|uniref:WYL domain-containing protein n=1 Tax=Paradevosia shaoguanensis TaxID=1335043 RepID=UPI003C74A0AB
MLKSGAWYLVSEGGFRTYRVSRILKLTILGRRFDYPKSFNLEVYWSESTRRYEKGLHPNRAEIRRSPWA